MRSASRAEPTRLVVALHALGVGPGDEVITSAFGFVAAPEAIVRVGARPVFVDVEPSALSLDPYQVQARLPRARAPWSRSIFSAWSTIWPRFAMPRQALPSSKMPRKRWARPTTAPPQER